MICFGLLLMICSADKPAVISDFCSLTRQEIANLRHLSEAEARALKRNRLDAINSLKRSYTKYCEQEPSKKN